MRHTTLESAFFEQLQTAVLTTDVIEYLVTKLLKAQQTKAQATEHDKRMRDLEGEIKRIVAAIAAVGHSDALVFNLKSRESEMRELSASKQTQRALTAEEIRAFVSGQVANIPGLLAKSPQLAKTKLAQHIDRVRMLPQTDGTYVADGKWDLLGNRGPVMVAGAGFEPATFGL